MHHVVRTEGGGNTVQRLPHGGEEDDATQRTTNPPPTPQLRMRFNVRTKEGRAESPVITT